MSLKVCALASGSKGNSCFVTDGRTHLLIDLGISATRAESCLKVLGADPNRTVVLITHSHSDHIGGLKIFCKKHPSVRVVCQRECFSYIRAALGFDPIVAAREFTVGTLCVRAVPSSHDVPCFGYTVSEGGGKRGAGFMTDIGRMGVEQLTALGECGLVVLESNYDPAMLRANPMYSAALKERIASDRGHLSNPDCAAACTFLASGGVKKFVLAHLSEENNTPELAVANVQNALREAGVYGADVSAASQSNMTELFEL